MNHRGSSTIAKLEIRAGFEAYSAGSIVAALGGLKFLDRKGSFYFSVVWLNLTVASGRLRATHNWDGIIDG